MFVYGLGIDELEWRAEPGAPKRGVTVWAAEHHQYAGPESIGALIERAYNNRSGVAYDRQHGLRVAFDWDAYS